MNTITGKDVQEMVSHWAGTPVNGYLGSDYGQDAKSILQRPQSDSGVAEGFIQKMRTDVPVLKSLPDGATNLYGVQAAPDRLDLVIEVAGQAIQVPGL